MHFIKKNTARILAYMTFIYSNKEEAPVEKAGRV
jgi:hypothetical protein